MVCPRCQHSIVLVKTALSGVKKWEHAIRTTDCDCDCDEAVVDMYHRKSSMKSSDSGDIASSRTVKRLKKIQMDEHSRCGYSQTFKDLGELIEQLEGQPSWRVKTTT